MKKKKQKKRSEQKSLLGLEDKSSSKTASAEKLTSKPKNKGAEKSKKKEPSKQKRKRKRPIKFEDLLALYKFIKDIWGSLTLIRERLDRTDEKIHELQLQLVNRFANSDKEIYDLKLLYGELSRRIKKLEWEKEECESS